MYLTGLEAVALVGIVLALGIYAGIGWERERPKREHRAAIARHDVWSSLMEQAQTELREHQRRIREPDETTLAIIRDLTAAVDRLTPDMTGTTPTFPNMTDWEADSEMLRKATEAAKADRKRYYPALTPEDEGRLREYGINDPRLDDPSLGGVLRQN